MQNFASSLLSTSAFMSFEDLNPVRIIKEEIVANDHIIAIMGPRGAGKSSVIKAAAGRDFGVCHSLQPHTSQITAIRVKRGEDYVVLVDTSGSEDDDTYDTLKMISDWLRETPAGFTKPLKLCGILYLHRISDNRIGGTTTKNLEMFQKLCGKDRFERVILTTTMWPKDPPSDVNDAEGREEELRNDYWKFMIDKGSRIEPFDDTQASAWSILDNLIKKEKQAIQIQNELKKLWKDVPDTAAGKQLHGFNGTMIRRQKIALRQLLDEMGMTTDQEIKDLLVKEWLSLQEEQEKAAQDNQRLESRIGQKFIRIFSGKKERAITQFPYEDRCLDLISDILKNNGQRCKISKLSGDDAKTMYDFLCQVSSKEAFKKGPIATLITKLKRSLKDKNPTSHHGSSEPIVKVKYEDVYKMLLDIIRNDTPTSNSDGTSFLFWSTLSMSMLAIAYHGLCSSIA